MPAVDGGLLVASVFMSVCVRVGGGVVVLPLCQCRHAVLHVIDHGIGCTTVGSAHNDTHTHSA